MLPEPHRKTATDKDVVLDDALHLAQFLEHFLLFYAPHSNLVPDYFYASEDPGTIEIDDEKQEHVLDKMKGVLADYYALVVENLEEFGRQCLCTLDHPCLAFVHNPRFRPCYHGAGKEDVPLVAREILELERGLERLPFQERVWLSQQDQITILQLLDQLEKTDVAYRALRSVLFTLYDRYGSVVNWCGPFAEIASDSLRRPENNGVCIVQ